MSNTEQPNNKRQLYIVLSRTGTNVSKIIRFVTKAKYNHVSLSLDPELKQMYSFGRHFPRNPIWAGFVQESKDSGFFKRFKDTEVQVLAIDIDEQTYQDMKCAFNYMYDHKFSYHYNYIGLVLAAFHIQFKPAHTYYCSEFAKEILIQHNIKGAEDLDIVPQPIHFADIPNTVEVYTGKLACFPNNAAA